MLGSASEAVAPDGVPQIPAQKSLEAHVTLQKYALGTLYGFMSPSSKRYCPKQEQLRGTSSWDEDENREGPADLSCSLCLPQALYISGTYSFLNGRQGLPHVCWGAPADPRISEGQTTFSCS